jgi:hypothetical protein
VNNAVAITFAVHMAGWEGILSGVLIRQKSLIHKHFMAFG